MDHSVHCRRPRIPPAGRLARDGRTARAWIKAREVARSSPSTSTSGRRSVADLPAADEPSEGDNHMATASPALSAVALVCSLKPSPARSSSELLARQVLAALGKHGVTGTAIRVADHAVATGVDKDMGDGDAWPEIRRACPVGRHPCDGDPDVDGSAQQRLSASARASGCRTVRDRRPGASSHLWEGGDRRRRR